MCKLNSWCQDICQSSAQFFGKEHFSTSQLSLGLSLLVSFGGMSWQAAENAMIFRLTVSTMSLKQGGWKELKNWHKFHRGPSGILVARKARNNYFYTQG